MTQDDFRNIALGFTGASEGSHMGHPDFRADGRIFATIAPDGKRGMVKLTAEQQESVLRNSPAACEPTSGAWGRGGATMVIFANADEDLAAELLGLARNNVKK